jgi:protein-S-isoprenylcysteine O-methyltransferase Ste14
MAVIALAVFGFISLFTAVIAISPVHLFLAILATTGAVALGKRARWAWIPVALIVADLSISLLAMKWPAFASSLRSTIGDDLYWREELFGWPMLIGTLYCLYIACVATLRSTRVTTAAAKEDTRRA